VLRIKIQFLNSLTLNRSGLLALEEKTRDQVATEYGKALESSAITALEIFLNCKVRPSGLMVDANLYYLAASLGVYTVL